MFPRRNLRIGGRWSDGAGLDAKFGITIRSFQPLKWIYLRYHDSRDDWIVGGCWDVEVGQWKQDGCAPAVRTGCT